jgi:hypothetical protein
MSFTPLVRSLMPERLLRLSSKPSSVSAAPASATQTPKSARGKRAILSVFLVAGVASAATLLTVPRMHGSDRQVAREHRAGAPSLKPTEGGEKHVRWQVDSIDIVIDKSFSDVAGPTLFGSVVDAWRATGAALPSVSTMDGEDRKVGYDPAGPNQNVVVFAPDGWAKARGALAVTVLTFDAISGKIVDADLLINGKGRSFANLDRDESTEGQAPISIENASSEDSSHHESTIVPYDLPSVVTHELGHFFGLGEDYTDPTTTMYAFTSRGEIHKRQPTESDSQVITALYAENEHTGGCGKAQLAPSGSSPSSWIGFGMTFLGVPLLLKSARRRRVGKGLTIIGLLLVLTPPNVRAEPRVATERGDAEAQVVSAAPRWADGIIETELTFRVTTCHVARCPDAGQRVVVTGGTVGAVTQIVGPFTVPRVGERVSVRLRDARGVWAMLAPTFQPNSREVR